MPDLLIELFSEEIPARMQARARDDLKRLVTDGLVEAGLTYSSAGAFSTPRRLALSVEGLSAHSPTTREERKGPRVDAPEKAIDGFLRATGLSREALEIRDEKKGQVYYATLTREGRPAEAIVAEVLADVIRNFPWPKSMRWGSGSLRWVRPLHSILCLLTDEAGARVVDVEIDGIRAGNTTRGHRFMAPDAFEVSSFEDYAAGLRRAKVILDASERAEAIRQDAANQAFARGLEIIPDEGLLTEVAGLVEWPVVLMGQIDAQFLDLPPEVLQTSMKEHQKFFSARNPRSGRIEGFVTVANIETHDDGATILAGNQRVLAARLSDAAFFWDNDLRQAKSGMAAWEQGLSAVTFHNKLGSQAERVARITTLARDIAPMVGAEPEVAAEAARLAKLDLRSEMVGEFPELQGKMGEHYALAAGADPEIAAASRAHYQPLGPNDDVPSAPVSVAVALADKLDTLTGFWAIDEKPTGSKDPFALRRAALGVIRLIIANGLRMELRKIIGTSFYRLAILNLFDEVSDEEENDRRAAAHLKISEEDARELRLEGALESFTPEELDEFHAAMSGSVEPSRDSAGSVTLTDSLLGFIHDRLKVHLRDEGIRHDVIDAVLAQEGSDDLTSVAARARALAAMLDTEQGANLVQGIKRASNILAQAEEKDGVEYSFGADPKFAETDEERALFAALDSAEPQIDAALSAEDYPAAMAAIAQLRGPVDGFFEAVQVNAENQILRRNRLNLLSRIRDAGRRLADFGRIDG